MEVFTYKVRIVALREGGFMVTVPRLPGCITWGATYVEAVAMAQEAIEGYLAALAGAGEPIPVEKQEHSRQVTMLVKAPALA